MAETILDIRTRIETPENALLSFRVAGPGPRLGAYLLDLFFRVAILFAVGYVLGFLGILGLQNFSAGVQMVVLFGLEWGYGTLFEAFWNGSTPGKRMLGLRVLKAGGYSISFYDAMIRNLLRAADFLPLFYGVGFLTMFSNDRFQRLGDLVAGTVVVREQRQVLRGTLDFVRSVEPLPASQLERHYVPSERTLSLIETFFRRWGDQGSRRADEIAWILARPLAERLGYRDEEGQDLANPVLFLLRILRTFAHVSEREPTAKPDARRAVSVLEREAS